MESRDKLLISSSTKSYFSHSSKDRSTDRSFVPWFFKEAVAHCQREAFD